MSASPAGTIDRLSLYDCSRIPTFVARISQTARAAGASLRVNEAQGVGMSTVLSFLSLCFLACVLLLSGCFLVGNYRYRYERSFPLSMEARICTTLSHPA
jgi:hypothetical protein